MDVSNITDLICPDRKVNIPNLVHGSQIIATIICFTFGLLERRKFKCQQCCNGRPGLVFPINLLDDFENRWAYSSAFGGITNTIVILFFGGQAISEEYETITKVSLGIAFSLEVCVAYAPIFICIITRFQLFGAVVGLLYSSIWFGAVLENTIQCIDPFPEVVAKLGLVLQLPCLICLGFLVGKFLLKGVRSALTQNFVEKEHPHRVACQFQKVYVRNLFPRKIDETPDGRLKRCYKFIVRTFFNEQDNFRFSTRLICTLCVVLLCNYQLATLYYYFNAWLFYQTELRADYLLNITGIPENSTVVEGVLLGLSLLTIGWDIINVVIYLTSLVSLVLILAKYRKNLLQLHRGDRSFLPADYNLTSAETLRSSMLFPGYQIAYQIWGYFLFVFVAWIFVVIIALIIILPVALGTWDVIIWIFYIIMVPGILSLTLRYSQKLLAQYVFLQDKIEEESDDKPLNINNRRFYHIMNYFLFIANIQVGLFSSLFRIARSFLWGILYLGRIDQCVLMPGKESLDKGYNAYVGMILVENAHNHPVLRTFCQILLNKVHINDLHTHNHIEHEHDMEIYEAKYTHHKEIVEVDVEKMEGVDNNDDPEETENDDSNHQFKKAPSSTYARTRWHLAYTLSNNPELITLRKHNLIEHTATKAKLPERMLEAFKRDMLGVRDSVNTRHHSISVDLLVHKQRQENFERRSRYRAKQLEMEEEKQETENYNSEHSSDPDDSSVFQDESIQDESIHHSMETEMETLDTDYTHPSDSTSTAEYSNNDNDQTKSASNGKYENLSGQDSSESKADPNQIVGKAQINKRRTLRSSSRVSPKNK